MGFEALVKQAGEHARKRRTIEVDISAFVGKEAGSEIVTLREPDVQTIYASGKQAEQLRAMHPGWEEALCGQVTMLALCHVAPAVTDNTPVGLLYAQMAEQNSDLFMFISAALDAACPELAKLTEEVAKRKAGEAKGSTSVFSASDASAGIL